MSNDTPPSAGVASSATATAPAKSSRITVRILNTPTPRKLSMAASVAIKENDRILYTMYWPHGSFTKELKRDSTVMIINAKREDTQESINLEVNKTKVFPTQAFNVNPTLLDHFNHAEVMTIPDILKTPEKRKVRLSIDGTVTQVSPVQSNKNWRRRDITISQDSQSVRCKLWNEKVDIIQEQHLNKRLKIENLETEHYNQSVSCRNTPETVMETPDEECQKTFTIIAVNTSTKEMLVTMDGEDQSLTYTDAVITDDEDLPTPMKVTGTIKGQELVYLDV